MCALVYVYIIYRLRFSERKLVADRILDYYFTSVQYFFSQPPPAPHPVASKFGIFNFPKCFEHARHYIIRLYLRTYMYTRYIPNTNAVHKIAFDIIYACIYSPHPNHRFSIASRRVNYNIVGDILIMRFT